MHHRPSKVPAATRRAKASYLRHRLDPHRIEPGSDIIPGIRDLDTKHRHDVPNLVRNCSRPARLRRCHNNANNPVLVIEQERPRIPAIDPDARKDLVYEHHGRHTGIVDDRREVGIDDFPARVSGCTTILVDDLTSRNRCHTTRRYADDRPIGLHIADDVGINETFHYRAGNGTVNEIISPWIQRYPPLQGRDPIGGRAGIVPCRL